MKQKPSAMSVKKIEQTIYVVRGARVMLDADLARLYGVETKALNRAVKRNKQRFPADFMFRLTRQELENLRCQFGTSSLDSHGGRRFLPYAFTEHGAIMAANVLNSSRATQMSVFVVRAFVRMRAMLTDNRELAAALKALEKELKERLDTHEAAIVDILRRLMDIIDPPALPDPPKKEIGFHVKEKRSAYRIHKKKV